MQKSLLLALWKNNKISICEFGWQLVTNCYFWVLRDLLVDCGCIGQLDVIESNWLCKKCKRNKNLPKMLSYIHTTHVKVVYRLLYLTLRPAQNSLVKTCCFWYYIVVLDCHKFIKSVIRTLRKKCRVIFHDLGVSIILFMVVKFVERKEKQSFMQQAERFSPLYKSQVIIIYLEIDCFHTHSN